MNATVIYPATATTSTHVPDLRKHLRFPCIAEAEATTLDGRRRLLADVSELSRCGCYLDTPEPFDVGTKIRLSIRHNGRSCELPGRVIYVHKGWGMGVMFGDIEAGQTASLDEWLVELCQKSLIGIET